MSEEIKLVVGDVVQLNSGGPKMTVVSDNGNFIKCQFFDKQDLLYAKDFAKGTLKKIEVKKVDIESTMPVFK